MERQEEVRQDRRGEIFDLDSLLADELGVAR